MERSLIVPTSLKDIKLHQYLEFEKLPETLSDFDRAIQTISIFCEINTHEIKKIPYKTLEEILNNIKEALSDDPGLIRTFELNGIKYGFIPNLDEITTAEFIDIDNYQKERDNLYKIMSVLYRPIKQDDGKHYTIEAYNGKINEDFQEIPMAYVKGAMLFFCNLGSDLVSYILKSLAEENPKDSQMREFQRSVKNGDGTALFTDLLTETYSKLMLWYASLYTRHYCGKVMYSIFKKFKNQN
jgi:hypothetical protein